ncbi:hypothetical protein PMI08_05377, partial [Brevibacillus sp. CF112]|uniref:hypothetical protein n=1 Tax=Brevibacillus sp. CF112 TaxID=1144311 RepID=UPI000271BC6A
ELTMVQELELTMVQELGLTMVQEPELRVQLLLNTITKRYFITLRSERSGEMTPKTNAFG